MTAIESHGGYDPVTESATNANSSISELSIVHNDDNYTAVSIRDAAGRVSVFVQSNSDADSATDHDLALGGNDYSWTGPFHYFDR